MKRPWPRSASLGGPVSVIKNDRIVCGRNTIRLMDGASIKTSLKERGSSENDIKSLRHCGYSPLAILRRDLLFCIIALRLIHSL